MRDHICPPEHKHGESPTCYRAHRCGCQNCRTENTRRGRERKARIAAGQPTSTLTTAARLQDHITELVKAGIPVAAIARVTGLDNGNLLAIYMGDPRRPVFSETARKVQVIVPNINLLPDNVKVSSRGVQRRIQALGARGWPLNEIANRLGWSENRKDNIWHVEHIHSHIHRAMSHLYEELWDAPPPGDTFEQCVIRDKTIRRAQRLGWKPPLAWDDIDTDDEAPGAGTDTAFLDDVAIELALRGERVNLTAAERAMVVWKGTQMGLSASELEERTQRSSRTITRHRKKESAA